MKGPRASAGCSALTEQGCAVARLVLVSGLSGAGKASILRALEDVGYEAVDNVPLAVLGGLFRRAATGHGPGIAIGIDARTHGFDAASLLRTLAEGRDDPDLRAELVYAWADDAVLQRRFSETRRRHPLALTGRVQDGIDAERVLTADLREAADLVIDTSDLSPPALRGLVTARYGGATAGRTPGLALTLLSFAFPAGLPRESDMVFDVRFLRNPHYVSELRVRTGEDAAVGAYVEADEAFQPFYTRLHEMLEFLLPRFVAEGKKYFTVAIGCTGGLHRSVHVVGRLARRLRASGWPVSVVHRELVRIGGTVPLEPAVASGLAQEV